MSRITIIDESTAGDKVESFGFDLDAADISVSELISLRVKEEIRRFLADESVQYKGLGARSDLEAALNSGAGKSIDEAAEVQKALKAFEQGQFILLIDEIQAAELSQRIPLPKSIDAAFIRIVPLVGG